MVDVVIPVLGMFDLLEKCLNSLPAAFGEIPYRVYIYDNATPLPMGEKQSFYSQFPVKVTYGKRNVGYPLACNIASKRGTGKYILLLNSDIEMFPSSGERLVNYLRSDETLGLLGMKLYFSEEVLYEHQAGRPAGKVQHYGISFNIHARPYHPFSGWSKDNPRVMNPIEPPAVTGAALMVRRSLWEKIGGYNSEYGLGTYEDCELCLEVQKLGKRVMVYPDCEAYHYTNATALHYQMGYPMEINNQIFYNKWHNYIIWSDAYLL